MRFENVLAIMSLAHDCGIWVPARPERLRELTGDIPDAGQIR